LWVPLNKKNPSPHKIVRNQLLKNPAPAPSPQATPNPLPVVKYKKNHIIAVVPANKC